MPGVGDQHSNVTNPFEETKPHVSEYTATEIATLQSRLEKQLGPEYISSRQGPGGGKVHYLAADKCINLANEVFGFNGWSSSIQNIQVDFADENPSGRVSLGLSVTVRVTLRDGTYHEDIGYGHIENCKGKAPAFEKAKKEGTTDALKRALRNFGNLLGNCIYDKDFVARVTKIKAGPTKWDPENLHRHQDFDPVKREQSRSTLAEIPPAPNYKKEPTAHDERTSASALNGAEDDFGSDDFDAADFSVPNGDHPDEIMIDTSGSSENSRRTASPSTRRSNCLPRTNMPPPPMASKWQPVVTKPGEPQLPLYEPGKALPQNLPAHSSVSREPNLPALPRMPDAPNTNGQQPSEVVPPETPQTGVSVSFVSARAASTVQSGSHLQSNAPSFNPRLESPSIRKTAGFDHSKTKPVNRETLGPTTTNLPPTPGHNSNNNGMTTTSNTTTPNMNVVNPQTDRTRKVGMPMTAAAASPLQNRSAYRPPTQMKRQHDGTAVPTALRDVTAHSVNMNAVGGGDPADVKRLKLASELP